MIRFLIFFLLIFLLSCGNAEGDGPQASLPELTILSVSKFEGNDQNFFDFKVLLSRESNQTVEVHYSSKAISASPVEDYVESSGKLTFAAGETQQIVRIEIIADTLKEGDEEFEVMLYDPVHASISNAKAIGTIRNDDTFLAVSDDGYTSPEGYAGWSLVWRDEFEGASIDPSNWTHEIGNHGWGNNEWQYYTDRPENSYISDGVLVIEARKENFGGSNYTSARMISAGMKEFRYGRIDIRAKLPEGQGIWPALWMLGSNFWTTGWPACGEIDIMELIGHQPSTVYGTAHWESNGIHADFGGSTSLDSGKFSDQFNVFSIIWNDKKIEWFMNDKLYHSLDITPAALSEFHQSFFFIFNIAVGGNWPGYPDATTQFPQRMFVDYIRVFQK